MKKIICIVLFFLTSLLFFNNVYAEVEDIDFVTSGGIINLTLEIIDGKVTDQYDIYSSKDYTNYNIEALMDGYKIGPNNGYVVSYEKLAQTFYIKTKGKSQALESYINSSRLSSCFELVNYNYIKSKKRIEISTSQEFGCMDLEYNVYDEMNLVIKTYNKVYENNADTVEGNTYSWKFNANNMDDHRIIFSVGNGKYVWYYYFRRLFYGLLLVGAIFLFGYIIISIFKGFSNKANKI